MEKAHGSQVGMIASQLATQFEAADDIARAAKYLRAGLLTATHYHDRTEVRARLEEAHARLQQKLQSRDRDTREILLLFSRIAAALIDMQRYQGELLDAGEEDAAG